MELIHHVLVVIGMTIFMETGILSFQIEDIARTCNVIPGAGAAREPGFITPVLSTPMLRVMDFGSRAARSAGMTASEVVSQRHLQHGAADDVAALDQLVHGLGLLQRTHHSDGAETPRRAPQDRAT